MGDAGNVTTLGEQGYRLPADFEPHDRCVISWPTMRRIDFWRNHLGAARDSFAVVIRALAEFEPVLVVADEGEGRAAEAWVGDGIEVVELPIDDCWLRDNGPIVLRGPDGDRRAVHFRFNGWGGKLAPWDRDAEVASALCDHIGIDCVPAPVVLEGGALSSNGEGTVLATEQSVLHPNRNADVTREAMEAHLHDYLGVDRVVWLGKGLADDTGTDGHVDNVAAFVGPDRVVLQTTTDVSDPDHATGRDNRARLEAAGLHVIEIDVLPHVQCFDQVVEVPYLNFYAANEAVLVPVAGAAADGEMVDRIAESFPGRKPVHVPGSVLAYGGGGIRCLTRPIPA